MRIKFFYLAIATLLFCACNKEVKPVHEQTKDTTQLQVDSSYMELIPDFDKKVASHLHNNLKYWWHEAHTDQGIDSSFLFIENDFQTFEFHVISDTSVVIEDIWSGTIDLLELKAENLKLQVKLSSGADSLLYSYVLTLALHDDFMLNQIKVDSLYLLGVSSSFPTELLDELSVDELTFLKYEFYARKNMKFEEQRLKAYFKQFDWYKPQYDNVEEFFQQVEIENLNKLDLSIKSRAIQAKTVNVDLVDSLFIIGTERYYTSAELQNVRALDLYYLKNYFYAVHGETFQDQNLQIYFKALDLYHPMHNGVDGFLTSTAQQNIQLINTILEARHYYDYSKN